MTLNEFLNTSNHNSDAIFEYYLHFLTNLSSNNFPYEEQLQLKGISEKFLSCASEFSYIINTKKDEYLGLIDKFSNNLRNYRRWEESSTSFSRIFIPKKYRLYDVQDNFEQIYSLAIKYINEASNAKNNIPNNLILNGLYKPENSNKQKIKDIINEAIELINSESSLKEKSKKEIITYLEKVLKNLDEDYTNWPKIIGQIKETIIVLGALGSLAGGLSPLLTAQEKLEETNIIIQQTSVNINYNTLNETFNMQLMPNLEKFTYMPLLTHEETIKTEDLDLTTITDKKALLEQ